MIISAKEHTHPNFRKYTVKSAIAAMLDMVQVNEWVKIDVVLDAFDQPQDWQKVRMNINKCKDDREFVTRVTDGKMNITRVC